MVFARDVVLLLVVVSASSFSDAVFGVLSFFFPLVDVLRSNEPFILVLQIIILSGLRFIIFHKVIQIVFPSFGWSSCSPLSLCRYDKTGFHSPAFLVQLSGFWVAIRRACRQFSFFCVSTQLVMLLSAFFISFFRASFHVSSLLNRLLGLLLLSST